MCVTYYSLMAWKKKETRKRKGSISFSPLKHCSVTFFIPCSNVIHHILKCCNNFLANFYLPISLLTKQEENKYRCERLPSNGKCESHLYVIPVNFPVFSYAKLGNLSLVCHLSWHQKWDCNLKCQFKDILLCIFTVEKRSLQRSLAF